MTSLNFDKCSEHINCEVEVMINLWIGITRKEPNVVKIIENKDLFIQHDILVIHYVFMQLETVYVTA